MNNDIGVITIPIGVGERGLPLGLTITPLVSSILSRNLNATNVLGINTLDTYKIGRERYVPQYLEVLNSLQITPDAIWNDKKEIQRLLDVFTKLKSRGFIKKSREKILKCECGKVEILKDSPMRDGAKLYAKQESGFVCKQCGKLREIEKDVLIMQFPKEITRPFVPMSVNEKEVNELFNRIQGMKYLVSRDRNTGVKFDGFNIDVDFSFLNFLNTMNFRENIIVGSNHVNWHMCMAIALKQCLDPDSKNTLVSTAYVYDRNAVLPTTTKALDENPMLKKAFLIGSLTWNKINTNWSLETLKTLSKSDDKELEAMIKYIETEVDGNSIEDRIKRSLKRMKKDTLLKVRKDYREDRDEK